jgi:N6-L-threonylcarbamoyladenine synthase
MGQTVDDAAGECFDKAARILGLGYPGGPEISKYAKEYVDNGKSAKFDIKLPRPMIGQKNYNFSFSGLKTAVLYLHQKQAPEVQKDSEYLRQMSYEIETAIVEVLVAKAKRAALEVDAKSIIIGGGVSANQVLRKNLEAAANDLGVKFLAPAPDLSVDNAAMAGASAYFAWKRNEAVANLDDLQSAPNLGI